jgi:hypothetical protein
MLSLKLFPSMTGIWEGTYTRLSENAEVMFTHKSKLSLHLSGKEWRQANLYAFDSGREEFHNFGMSPFNENGVMKYDNHRIIGEAWEANGGKNILLWWSYKQFPGSMLYEMITPISSTHRMRVWQHSMNGKFEGLTMIEEWKTADQSEIPMSLFDQASYIKEA